MDMDVQPRLPRLRNLDEVTLGSPSSRRLYGLGKEWRLIQAPESHVSCKSCIAVRSKTLRLCSRWGGGASTRLLERPQP